MAIKNVTLRLEEDLIEAARAEARRRNTSLNAEFRRWLADFAAQTVSTDERSKPDSTTTN
jgi:hypothetical protein